MYIPYTLAIFRMFSREKAKRISITLAWQTRLERRKLQHSDDIIMIMAALVYEIKEFKHFTIQLLWHSDRISTSIALSP